MSNFWKWVIGVAIVSVWIFAILAIMVLPAKKNIYGLSEDIVRHIEKQTNSHIGLHMSNIPHGLIPMNPNVSKKRKSF